MQTYPAALKSFVTGCGKAYKKKERGTSRLISHALLFSIRNTKASDGKKPSVIVFSS